MVHAELSCHFLSRGPLLIHFAIHRVQFREFRVGCAKTKFVGGPLHLFHLQKYRRLRARDTTWKIRILTIIPGPLPFKATDVMDSRR